MPINDSIRQPDRGHFFSCFFVVNLLNLYVFRGQCKYPVKY